MNNSEAWDIVHDLRGAVEEERYALYYVGMSDRKEKVIDALGQALHCLSKQMFPEPQAARGTAENLKALANAKFLVITWLGAVQEVGTPQEQALARTAEESLRQLNLFEQAQQP